MRNRFGGLTEEEETKIDITPMLDVVFIMLIFFIVTATFVNESGLNLNKPDVPVNPDPPKKEDQNILVQIYPNDHIYIKGRKSDFRTVTANIKRLKSEYPDGAVVIQASKRSRNETLAKVIDSIQSAGVYNPIIAPSTE
ncbi:MAG: biopolymer transporter ExbD [Gammaproteobacteria bacterium]|nr:biopolymer transporter ExbD [Gammaproteobacteria bacterium]NNC97967.1 biopolymer transporter ExbD [Gammaproteobacteria bacterium]NNM13770.1 biopolymer transporter ExbD [Gammaproteobacteria bacterium]